MTVEIGSETLPEYDYVSEVVVDTTVDGADHCSATLTHPFDHEQVAFEDLPWGEVDPTEKKSVSVELGFGESLTQVFSGEVETVRGEFDPGAPPKVVVTAFGPLRNMMRGTNANKWTETPLKDIVSEVAGSYLSGVDTQNAGTTLDVKFQRDHQSDYAFVRELADNYGFEFFADLGDGYFRPDPGGSPPDDPVATLYYGESIEQFSGEVQRPDHGEVEVRYWDETAEKEIVGSASNADGDGAETYRLQVDSAAEADALAKGKLQSTTISGTVETFGIPSIRAGTVIELDGLGKTFSTTYYVTDATHRFSPNGYTMTMQVTDL